MLRLGCFAGACCVAGVISAFAEAEQLGEQLGTWDYPPTLPEAREEVYKTIGDTKLNLYLFTPEGHKQSDRRPAIVFFFGGGWRGGTPGQFHPQCKYLASRGMVAITADYRVKSRQGATPMQCIADAKSAIRWVRREADRLGIDPTRIVACGGSAGGHLAACTGIVPGFDEPEEDADISSVPNALALYNPAIMLAPYKGEDLIGEEKVARFREMADGTPEAISPIHHVRSGLPPTIIFHGTKDEAVPYPTVVLFDKHMRAEGNVCKLKGYVDQPHGFFNTGRGGDEERQTREMKMYRSTTRSLDEFLTSLGYLVGQPTIKLAE